MRAFLATVVGGLCAVTASAQVEPTGNIRQTNEDARTSVGLAELKSAFPSVGVVRDQGEITALYGLMTHGETPEAAILDFVAEHADAFGIADIELHPHTVHVPGYGAATVVSYGQEINGIPVEYSRARVMVNNDLNTVVFAAGRFATPNVDGMPTANVTADEALGFMQADPRFASYPEWSTPEMVIYAGEDLRSEARQAWKFVADGPRANFGRFTFFVDAVTGNELFTRNEIIEVDVAANVQGNLTPGTLPDIAGNNPVVSPLLGARVSVGGNFAFSDENGDAVVSNGGSGSVTATSGVTNGEYVTLNNTAGGEQSESVNVTPPGPANFTLAPGAGEFPVAQVNTLHHTNLVAEYLLDRGYNGFDNVFPTLQANVNWDSAGGISSCNAFWDGSSINFFREKGGCVNSAYSTVVAHEFGHGVVQTLGLSQGAFGEGFGDTMAVLLYDVGIVGENFLLSGGAIRNIDAANQQYPCTSGAIHTCGQILAGVFRDIRLNFTSTYGSSTGLERARQLHVDWLQITNGGIGLDSAHPTTAIEVLTANDDDGNIGNGTPDYNDICDAFLQHGIECPEIQLVGIAFPNGRPTQLNTSGPTNVDVTISDISGSPVGGTEALRYRINGTGGFQTAALTPNGGDSYIATFPAVSCGDSVEYFIETDTNGGVLVTSPSNAPTNTYSAFGAGTLTTQFDDNFETDLGWRIAGTAVDGNWDRGVPVDCNRGDPSSDFDGSGQCYLTDNSAANSCNSDVDDGEARLITPVFDLTSADDAIISWAAWFDNLAGNAPGQDNWIVQIRLNGAGAWTDIQRTTSSFEWTTTSILASDYGAAGQTFEIRFIAEDINDGSVVEAGVDAFKVEILTCDSSEPCPEDVDGSGSIDLSDLAVLLANFGQTGASAEDGDIDLDGDVDLSDLAALLAAFGQTCP